MKLHHKIMGFVKRRKMLTLALVLAAWFSLTPIIIFTRTYAVVHSSAKPQALTSEPVLEEQTETFTCGVHALSTVYRAYGLDPEEERIRWRLGVDTKAVCWMGDSTGALHPDLYMVLVQDFFRISALRPEQKHAWRALKDHLHAGHLGILLIRRRENEALHWVVAARTVGERIEIYDSLHSDPYWEERDFMDQHVVSALMIQPAPGPAKVMSSIAALLSGSSELLKANTRIRAL